MRIALFTFLFATALLRGQSLELQTGEIVAGQIVAVTEASVTVATGYPEVENKTLAREALAPRSWLQVLQSRASATDGKAHLALATTAEQLGLPGHALAELQTAARLDASLRAEVDRKIAALRSSVAAELLTSARDAAAAGRHGEARLTAKVITERYADSPSAVGAREVIAVATKALRTAVPATSGAADAKAVAAAVELESKAERLATTTGGGIGPTVQETRKREQAVKLLERALTAVESTGGDDAASVRQRLRDKLRDQYLALATNLLQRRSLDRATEYNGMACALDPEHGGCHHLQDQIVQARLTFGY